MSETDEAPRRGRPPKDESPRSQQVKRERRRRGDMGENSNMKLAVPDHAKDQNFTYRWINDTIGGRVQNMTQHDDWDIVSDGQIDGQGEGTQVARSVGAMENGNPLRAYLCRKPKDFHEEDQQAKRAAINSREEELKEGPAPNSPGLTAAEAYVPQGHKNVITGGPT